MKISPGISVNKKCHSYQWFLAFNCEWGLPKLRYSKFCHSPWWLLKNSEGRPEVTICHFLRWTRKGTWPQKAGMHVKGKNSVSPEGLHLPIHKILNSLTWYLILMFTWPALFVIRLYIAQFFCPPPWSSFLRATEVLSLHIAHKFFSRVLDVTLHPWRKIPPLKERNEKCRHQSGGNTQWRKY